MARDQLRLKERDLSITFTKDCILHPYLLLLLLDRLQVSHALKSVKDWTKILRWQLLIASELLQLLRAKIALRLRWLNLNNRTEEGDLAAVKIRRRLLCRLL